MTTGLDLNYFLELEAISREYAAERQIFALSDHQKEDLLKAEFDYEYFRYDFDLTCRFICFFSRVEKEKFSKLHILLLKYIFVLSSFLKNRISTKLTQKNDIFLEKATEILSSDSRISLPSLSEDIKNDIFDSGKMFISFSLVNIYEITRGVKTSPTHPAAYTFLCNDFILTLAESSLVTFSYSISDFQQVGDSFDETVALTVFKKYNREERIKFRKSFETKNFHRFCLKLFFALVCLIIVTEVIKALNG